MSKPKTPKASKPSGAPADDVPHGLATTTTTMYRNTAGMPTTATTCTECAGTGCTACGGFGFQTTYAKGLGL